MTPRQKARQFEWSQRRVKPVEESIAQRMVSVVSDDVARQRHLSTWNDLWHDILKYRQSAFRALFAKNDQLQESLNSIAPQRTRKQPKKTPLPLWKFAQARVLHAESCPWRRQRKERVQLSRSELYNNAMYDVVRPSVHKTACCKGLRTAASKKKRKGLPQLLWKFAQLRVSHSVSSPRCRERKSNVQLRRS